jgi:hypothetical protein
MIKIFISFFPKIGVYFGLPLNEKNDDSSTVNIG